VTKESGPSSTDVRSAFGAFATGVVVITAIDADRPIGLVANSFNVVSLDPPFVLWTLGPGSSNHEAFRRSPVFAANILGREQQALAERFAAKGGDKFDGVPQARGSGGVPVLAGCLATLECRAHSQHEVAESVVIVGRVERSSVQSLAPLLFYAGGFRHLAGSNPAPGEP
jgi:flavin reductase (DIM6/NTAB) family NADH-FMN oxidoreductase RutF